MRDIEAVLNELCAIELPNTFNPYRDTCAAADLPDAPRIRLGNLAAYINALSFQRHIDVWVGRDLGYRGGRRTGIALTDEAHLPALGKRLNIPMSRATHGPDVTERTAGWIWTVIQQIAITPFLWNAFPLHPHEPGDPFSNRSHTRSEFAETWVITVELLRLLRPRRVIAIGNDAVRNLEAVGVECHYVRHPSYGGQADFSEGMADLYGTSRLSSLPAQFHFAELN